MDAVRIITRTMALLCALSVGWLPIEATAQDPFNEYYSNLRERGATSSRRSMAANIGLPAEAFSFKPRMTEGGDQTFKGAPRESKAAHKGPATGVSSYLQNHVTRYLGGSNFLSPGNVATASLMTSENAIGNVVQQNFLNGMASAMAHIQAGMDAREIAEQNSESGMFQNDLTEGCVNGRLEEGFEWDEAVGFCTGDRGFDGSDPAGTLLFSDSLNYRPDLGVEDRLTLVDYMTNQERGTGTQQAYVDAFAQQFRYFVGDLNITVGGVAGQPSVTVEDVDPGIYLEDHLTQVTQWTYNVLFTVLSNYCKYKYEQINNAMTAEIPYPFEAGETFEARAQKSFWGSSAKLTNDEIAKFTFEGYQFNPDVIEALYALHIAGRGGHSEAPRCDELDPASGMEDGTGTFYYDLAYVRNPGQTTKARPYQDRFYAVARNIALGQHYGFLRHLRNIADSFTSVSNENFIRQHVYRLIAKAGNVQNAQLLEQMQTAVAGRLMQLQAEIERDVEAAKSKKTGVLLASTGSRADVDPRPVPPGS